MKSVILLVFGLAAFSAFFSSEASAKTKAVVKAKQTAGKNQNKNKNNKKSKKNLCLYLIESETPVNHSGSEIQFLNDEQDSVLSGWLSDDSQKITVVNGNYITVKLPDDSTIQKAVVTGNTTTGHLLKVNSAIKWGAKHYLTVSEEHTVGLWRMDSENSDLVLVGRFGGGIWNKGPERGHVGAINNIARLSKKYFVTVSADHTIGLWRVNHQISKGKIEFIGHIGGSVLNQNPNLGHTSPVMEVTTQVDREGNRYIKTIDETNRTINWFAPNQN